MAECFNAGDPEAVAKRKRTAKDIAEQQQDDLRELLKLQSFRRYLWRHLDATCGFMQPPSVANGTLQSMAIGRQEVGRKLWDEVCAVDPLAIPLMMTEHLQANP